MLDSLSARVAVIGGGPAGLMAAEVLASKGAQVTVFDGKPSPARKFLMAGRGGLNLTHSEPLNVFETRYGSSAATLSPILAAFPPSAVIEWASGLGIPTFVGSSGRVFPKSLKTSPLLRAWLARLDSLGVTFRYRHDWVGWQKELERQDEASPQHLVFTGDKGERITHTAEAVVLALGGASWPRLGADGRWVPILKELGVAVSPLTPFNAGILVPWSVTIREKFAGAPLKRIRAKVGDVMATGEAVITKNGLEGGLIYQLNGPIKQQLAAHTKTTLTLDLRPDLSVEQLVARFGKPRGSQSMATFLRKTVKLSKASIAVLREPSNGDLPSDPQSLASLIKAVPLTITGINDIDRAISTSGGVLESELNDMAMLKFAPGVFVAGEMRDWDAPTGGYLLQATFATGAQAANGTLSWLAARSGNGKNSLVRE